MAAPASFALLVWLAQAKPPGREHRCHRPPPVGLTSSFCPHGPLRLLSASVSQLRQRLVGMTEQTFGCASLSGILAAHSLAARWLGTFWQTPHVVSGMVDGWAAAPGGPSLWLGRVAKACCAMEIETSTSHPQW